MTSDTWNGFIDDASPEPVVSDLVGTRAVRDTDLPAAPADRPLRVLLTGGAGQVAGPAGLCARRGLRLTAMEVALRDAGDPGGNARRVVAAVDAARADGVLADDVAVHAGVEGAPSPMWLAAADELAAAELALTLPLERLAPAELEAWVDAALDRELPFSVSGGSAEQAVAALRVTAALWGDAGDLAAARRWCRSWTTGDAADAVRALTALS